MLRVFCKCGQELTANTSTNEHGQLTTIQCSSCIQAAYDIGYTDGAATAEAKTDMADIIPGRTNRYAP